MIFKKLGQKICGKVSKFQNLAEAAILSSEIWQKFIFYHNTRAKFQRNRNTRPEEDCTFGVKLPKSFINNCTHKKKKNAKPHHSVQHFVFVTF